MISQRHFILIILNHAFSVCYGHNLTLYYKLFNNSLVEVNETTLPPATTTQITTTETILNPLVRTINDTLPSIIPTTVEEMLEGNVLLPTDDEVRQAANVTMRNRRQNLVRGMLRRAWRRRRRLDRQREDGTVRLVNGEKEHEGNVEIWHSGKWGSICDDEWDEREATVVCQQLGHPGKGTPTYNAQFGHTRPTIWMDNLACSGDEEELKDCRFDGWGHHDCSPSEAAGAVCNPLPTSPSLTTQPPKPQTTRTPKKLSSASAGIKAVRISGGRTLSEGRLEVLLSENDDWKLVCGDGWSLLEAGVVCHQLGLGYAVTATQTDYFGGTASNIILNGVKCTGQERTLQQCLYTRIGYGHCPGEGNNVAGVVCTSHMADLIPDHLEVMRSAYLEDKQLFYLSCALEENCVGRSAYALQEENSYGWHLETRRLLRFTARIANIGTAAFRPFLPKNMWEWHSCHMHYHSMEVFATYDVTDFHGKKVAEGHKASFCLEDAECKPGVEPVYNCDNFGDQGVSVGCTDTYQHNIDCQWVDMTDVEPGNYIFRIAINPEMKVGEQRFDNNAAVCNLLYTESYAYVWNCTLTGV